MASDTPLCTASNLSADTAADTADNQASRATMLAQIAGHYAPEISAKTVMFHQTVADRLGLSITDHKCLYHVAHAGKVTAGELAEVTGLTTGAITSVIDRLERGGFAVRERDVTDRRRVYVRAVPEKSAQVGLLFKSLGQAYAALCERCTDEELQFLAKFYEASIQLLSAETVKLANLPPGGELHW